MSNLYELATLSAPLLRVADLSERTCAYLTADEARGRLLGGWRTEIGSLGRPLVLRGFDNQEELSEERRRILLSANPFNAADTISGFRMESYQPFPFLPPVQLSGRGGVFEIRTYLLQPGGLPPTLAGWEQAIEPARDYTNHLVINMYALDGPPRITHLWGFESLEQRASLRSAAYGTGVWPPKGGPENILEAESAIALPETWSPLGS